MKNVKTILITAAICLPLGAFGAGALKGHPNLEKARASLNDADKWITASQKANEFDEGGHANKAKDAISLAKDELKAAAEYDNSKTTK
jgi:hypothetical protein